MLQPVMRGARGKRAFVVSGLNVSAWVQVVCGIKRLIPQHWHNVKRVIYTCSFSGNMRHFCTVKWKANRARCPLKAAHDSPCPPRGRRRAAPARYAPTPPLSSEYPGWRQSQKCQDAADMRAVAKEVAQPSSARPCAVDVLHALVACPKTVPSVCLAAGSSALNTTEDRLGCSRRSHVYAPSIQKVYM